MSYNVVFGSLKRKELFEYLGADGNNNIKIGREGVEWTQSD